MLSKVISGGQIGVDIAGLAAARLLGITTGGTAPKNWMTLRGQQEQALRLYGLVECDAKGYPARTERNVRNSDCTIRLAVDFTTPGEVCTMRYIAKHKKPYIDVQIFVDHNEGKISYGIPAKELAHWIISNKFDCINIAGNAKAFLEPHVERYLNDAFYRVLDYRNAEVPDE
jgi:hypothetical protein